MVEKVRPKTSIEYSFGNDGRSYEHYYIQCRCGGCLKHINSYKSENACEFCGTFRD